METRANYVLVGAFTLAGFVGLIGFFLWFAQAEFDRQFDYYDVKFPSVSGLSNASEVRFSGLSVGQVIEVKLDPDLSGLVVVRLEVDADTPVRTSSIATIESQGVTGVSYVGISAGEPTDPLLANARSGATPEITAGRSVLETLTQDTPKIIDEVLAVAKSVSELLGTANQKRLSKILENVESASGNLNGALDDFSKITKTVSGAVDNFAAVSDKLDSLSKAATSALTTAETTMNQITDLAKRAEKTLDVGDGTLASGKQLFDSANTYLQSDLPRITASLDLTISDLRDQINAVGTEADETLKDIRKTSSVATKRLEEAQATIASATTLLEGATKTVTVIDKAATRIDTFIDQDGTALVGDVRGVVASSSELVKSADATMGTINDLAKRAEKTLDAGDAALDSGKQAFDSANSFMQGDLPRISTGLDQTLADLRAQINTVGPEAEATLKDFRATSVVATKRLEEAQPLISSTAKMVDDVSTSTDVFDKTAKAFDDFISTDGTALVADARGVVASASELVTSARKITETELPGILADVRTGTQTAVEVVQKVGESLTSAAGNAGSITTEVTATLDTITTTFQNANRIMTEVSTTLQTGDSTLVAARSAFTTADRIMNDDIDEIVKGLNQVIAQLDTVIATVSKDVPVISSELRQTAERANAAFGQVESTAASLGPPLRTFAKDALPKFNRLAGETLELVSNIQQFVRQVERNPARYFFGGETPVYRR